MPHKHLYTKYLTPSLLFFGGVIIGFMLLSYVNNLFRIRKVEVIGTSSMEVKTINTILMNRSTIFTQQSEIKSSILARFPTFEVKSSHYIFPETLLLVVEKEKPQGYIITDAGYLAVSKKGTILSKERGLEAPHPAITFYQTVHHTTYQAGQKIGFNAVQRALLFIDILSELGYQTETVAIDSVDMIACKTKGFEVAFSQTRPIDNQSHEVRQIIRQIKAGALRIERLDLRFDKPVVQLSKK